MFLNMYLSLVNPSSDQISGPDHFQTRYLVQTIFRPDLWSRPDPIFRPDLWFRPDSIFRADPWSIPDPIFKPDLRPRPHGADFLVKPHLVRFGRPSRRSRRILCPKPQISDTMSQSVLKYIRTYAVSC